jgi:hypothetical protein
MRALGHPACPKVPKCSAIKLLRNCCSQDSIRPRYSALTVHFGIGYMILVLQVQKTSYGVIEASIGIAIESLRGQAVCGKVRIPARSLQWAIHEL